MPNRYCKICMNSLPDIDIYCQNSIELADWIKDSTKREKEERERENFNTVLYKCINTLNKK